MGSIQPDIILRNNTGNVAKSTLIDGFVIRHEEFHSILGKLLTSGTKKSVSCLVIGQRGTGKTTLLHRLKYAIEDNENKSGLKIPIMLTEEQYDIIELADLFEKIVERLEETSYYPNIYREFCSASNYSEKPEHAFNYISEILERDGRQVVVFIENIDILFKKIGKNGQLMLRSLLDNGKAIQLVGSATTIFDSISSAQDPFYNFFKIYTLRGLSKEDTLKFLLKIGEQVNESTEISNIVRRDTKRVEALRRLTGGNPRMISYLFNIFLDNANGKVIRDLYRLLDDLTFLYKAELDQLSAQQQKVIDCMARNWDAISVKELVAGTRIESKHVSSVLANLERNQIVEKIGTKSKNNLYIIKDRFLNIWYLMRFGKKKEKENVVWLVRFYDAWCDKQELSARVNHLFKNIAEGELDSKVALDMANTFLSCKNITAPDKYEIYTRTKEAFPKTVVEKLSTEILYKTIREHVKRKRYTEALAVLQELDSEDVAYFSFAYWIYSSMGNYKAATSYLERVFEIKQDHLTAHTLGQIFDFELQDIEKAESYYLLSLSKGNNKVVINLANLQYFKKHDVQSAIHTLEMGIANGISDAIMELATIYYFEGNSTEAERLCNKAIAEGNSLAYLNLSVLLQNHNRIEESIIALEKAISFGHKQAMVNLAEIYIESDKESKSKAVDILKQAIKEKVPGADYTLGKYYMLVEKNLEEAKIHLLSAARRKESGAAHLLGHLYHEANDWQNAEKWFLKSYELGHTSSLICLSNCAISSNIIKRKAFILSTFAEFISMADAPPVSAMIEYAKLLVWNGKGDQATEIIYSIGSDINQLLDQAGERVKEVLLQNLTELFIQIIASKKPHLALELFENSEVNFKQIIRPIYFALMNYLKKELPNEYLKAGADIIETVQEIISEIENRKKQIK